MKANCLSVAVGSLEPGDTVTAAWIELVVSTLDGSTTYSNALGLEARFVDDGGEVADLLNGSTWNNRSVSGALQPFTYDPGAQPIGAEDPARNHER